MIVGLVSAIGCGQDSQPPTPVPEAPEHAAPAEGRNRPSEVEMVAWMEAHYRAVILSHDALLQADRDYTVKPQLELRGICARLGLPYLDPHAEFLAHRDAELFTDGLHLTAAGHRLMGRLLVEFLEEEGLLPD